MHSDDRAARLEARIAEWRVYLLGHQTIHSADVAELEDHLREQIDGLTEAGLDADEAFLVAVKRMGDLDTLSAEFAREHSERLWKQLVTPGVDVSEAGTDARRDGVVAVALAVLAALLIKLPALFGLDFVDDGTFYARNLSFFVLPVLTGYFAWKRGLLGSAMLRWLGIAFVGAAVFATV